MKIYELSSSRETTPVPFVNDGEFGSDADYGPIADNDDDSDCDIGISQFERGKQRKKSLLHVKKSTCSNLRTGSVVRSTSDSASENSYNTTDDSEYSSYESIFDSYKRKCSDVLGRQRNIFQY
ncbi:unnamed protein product [Parnassius mnemosyne]|uniref:Uncharacterized protein n=1 Tax=Parnassius mnemosyne TaxID=213953 RepID=A0AAV1K7J2_9NEOP